MRKEISVVLLMLSLQACTLPITPLPTTTSTITAAPSDTPTPSQTLAPPTITPSLEATSSTTTVTLEPVEGPPTATPAPELGCRLVFKSVRDGRHFRPKAHFNAGWMVQNNGTAAWDPGSVDFVYVGGTRMAKSERVDLDETVSPDGMIPLTVEMVAPRQTGNILTIWSLRRGDEYFCRLTLRIRVP